MLFLNCINQLYVPKFALVKYVRDIQINTNSLTLLLIKDFLALVKTAFYEVRISQGPKVCNRKTVIKPKSVLCD